MKLRLAGTTPLPEHLTTAPSANTALNLMCRMWLDVRAERALTIRGTIQVARVLILDRELQLLLGSGGFDLEPWLLGCEALEAASKKFEEAWRAAVARHQELRGVPVEHPSEGPGAAVETAAEQIAESLTAALTAAAAARRDGPGAA